MADPGSEDGGPSEEELELVRRTARLARLELDPGEARRLALDFARLLEAFGELSRADLGAANAASEPPAPERGGERARDDVPAPLDPERVERLLRLAPERVESFFAVPRTLGSAEPEADRP